MSKRIKSINKIEEKNYGGSSIFFGSLLLIDAALIVYNLFFIQTFKELDQTYYSVSTNASFLEKLADRYFSFFARFFGFYPSTKVLAVTIPLAFVFLVWFLDDYTKYLKQKAKKKAANGFFETENVQTQEAVNEPDTDAENKTGNNEEQNSDINDMNIPE
jgi:hypothetical protein